MQNLLNKYRAIPNQVKASFWFVVSNILVRGISFITLPIFSRLLTTSEYGTVSVFQSWVSIITIITTLSIWGGVFNVGMVKYSDRKNELMSSFQGLSSTITIGCTIIAAVLLPLFSKWMDMSPLLVMLAFLNVLVLIPYNIWSTEQRYNYKYKALILISVGISILNPVLGYFAVTHTTFKAEARIASGLFIQVVVGIVFFILIQSKGKRWYSKEFWTYGFLFNVVLIPHYLSTQILNQSDRLMINSLCGSGDAGIYSVAYNFAMLLSLVTSGINSSLTPHIYKSLKEKKTDDLANQTTAVILFVALMAVGVTCIVPDLFMFMLPDSYYPALKVIPPVTAGAFFLFLYPMFGSVEFYYEENKYVTYASIGGAILNVVLNYIFIKIFGFIAAAYTTLFCYICFSFCHYYFMKKVMKKHNANERIYDFKAILIISLTLLVVSFVMLILYEYMIIRWIVIGIIIIFIILKRNEIILMVKRLLKKRSTT